MSEAIPGMQEAPPPAVDNELTCPSVSIRAGASTYAVAAPGRPATAIQKAGATTPSEKFSARLSIAARQTPARSSA